MQEEANPGTIPRGATPRGNRGNRTRTEILREPSTRTEIPRGPNTRAEILRGPNTRAESVRGKRRRACTQGVRRPNRETLVLLRGAQVVLRQVVSPETEESPARKTRETSPETAIPPASPRTGSIRISHSRLLKEFWKSCPMGTVFSGDLNSRTSPRRTTSLSPRP